MKGIAMGAVVLGCLAAPGVVLAQPNISGRDTSIETRGLRHTRLYGVASSMVLNRVNHNDARAALKVWFDAVAQQRGFTLDSRVDIVDGLTEVRDRLQSHTVDLLVLDILEYLELESSRLIVPILTHARGTQGRAPYSYVLLVNPSSGATTIAGLRGKNILVSSLHGSNAGSAWLDVLLGNEKLGRAASFFGSIKVPDKPQACILPVFFGTVDACVVDEVNLNLAKEMNPQLAKLTVLARSRPMIESVIAMPVEGHPYQKELIDAMLSLHEDPRGQQLLMVFKTDRLLRVQAGEIEEGREFWKGYYRLPGSLPSRPASFLSAVKAESDQSDRGKERD